MTNPIHIGDSVFTLGPGNSVFRDGVQVVSAVEGHDILHDLEKVINALKGTPTLDHEFEKAVASADPDEVASLDTTEAEEPIHKAVRMALERENTALDNAIAALIKGGADISKIVIEVSTEYGEDFSQTITNRIVVID